MRRGTGADRSAIRSRLRRAVALAIVLAPIPPAAAARVLSDGDLASIARIKPLYTDVLNDVARSAQNPDLAGMEGDCVRSTLRALLQIADELKGYEALITTAGELTDFGDDEALRNVLRFAVENALKILDTERRRLGELTETCGRSNLSSGKARQAIQFIDSTQAILRAVQPRL
ncbi:hypothetical protein OPKNFCMD_5500 [Methylobacterium crusticola]|uniref:Uncharacterized protein n=2 Tax=Methylobacterium crusticola TaxID=1697972 RepID=A0ABQ4R4V7_9HYPH|nr:hypothetical protein OPKNFCMD_5500 [Methylobacterium crusticola]